jgi:tRNA pseudouridine55 synthase
MTTVHSGALIIDKPEGLSSSDGVTRLKWALIHSKLAQKGFKIGHGGTLDPFATGVLVVLIGEATKLADCYLHSKKTYTGTIRLGISTDSGDPTGVPSPEVAIPELENSSWQELAHEFVRGPYFQVPPMHSAKKRDGVALYELARKGQTLEREAILKKIYSFNVTKDSPPSLSELLFEVSCESGTYVRVIAEDLAKKAGTLGHLTALRRTRSSDRSLDEALPLQECLDRISGTGTLNTLPNFIPLKNLATHIPSLEISPNDSSAIRTGQSRVIDSFKTLALQAEHPGRYLLLKDEFSWVALFERPTPQEGYRLQRVLNPPSS